MLLATLCSTGYLAEQSSQPGRDLSEGPPCGHGHARWASPGLWAELLLPLNPREAGAQVKESLPCWPSLGHWVWQTHRGGGGVGIRGGRGVTTVRQWETDLRVPAPRMAFDWIA